MCNAFNHPPGCRCGFEGGNNSGSFSFYKPQIYLGNSDYKVGYDSFLNPNAACPVCGAKVFFYQSSNGGRVYFDELGPPWPKHPCTDQSFPVSNSKKYISNKAHWHLNLWNPFLISCVTKSDKSILRLVGEHQGRNFSIYINQKDSVDLFSRVETSIVAHLKKINNSKYLLSLITKTGKAKYLKCYKFASDVLTQNHARKVTKNRNCLPVFKDMIQNQRKPFLRIISEIQILRASPLLPVFLKPNLK